MRRLTLIATAALAAGATHADPRITTRAYEPASVVVVHGHAGIESTIAFADDEHIENIAVGNSAAWQVTPNKRANLLFVKPAGAKAHTNMTVITDQRTYLFDLVSTAGMAPVYMMRFTYPDRPKVQMAAAPVPAPVPEAAVALAAAEPAPPVMATADPAALNFAWVSAGDRKLLPQRAFDDGHATFLTWAKDATLPAILTRGPAGQEGPVNFSIKGEYIVVDGVPAQIVLRAGKQMATLTPSPRAQAAVPAAPPATAADPPATVAIADRGIARP